MSICKKWGEMPMYHVIDFVRFESFIFYTLELAKPWNVLVLGKDECARFHFVKKGSCFIFEANSSRPVLAETGDIVFIVSKGNHHLSSDSGLHSKKQDSTFCSEDYFTLTNTNEGKIDASVLCGQIKPLSYSTIELFSSFPQLLHLKKSSMNKTQAKLSRCLSEVSTRNGTNEALAARITEALLISLLESYSRKLKSGWSEKYFQVLQDIQSNYNKPIDWNKYIWKLGVSRPVFFRRFNALTGLTPNKYLNSIRMKKALVLLESTDNPIKEISYDVGFQTPAGFTKKFKSYYGKTPSDIRTEK
jgi:AraC-like DNA-binding protein